jgi:hypothetical protein
MENQPGSPSRRSELIQLMAGTILLESFALASAYETVNDIEAGGEQSSFRAMVGMLGAVALAAGGAYMWKKFHEIRDRPD